MSVVSTPLQSDEFMKWVARCNLDPRHPKMRQLALGVAEASVELPIVLGDRTSFVLVEQLCRRSIVGDDATCWRAFRAHASTIIRHATSPPEPQIAGWLRATVALLGTWIYEPPSALTPGGALASAVSELSYGMLRHTAWPPIHDASVRRARANAPDAMWFRGSIVELIDRTRRGDDWSYEDVVLAWRGRLRQALGGP